MIQQLASHHSFVCCRDEAPRRSGRELARKGLQPVEEVTHEGAALCEELEHETARQLGSNEAAEVRKFAESVDEDAKPGREGAPLVCCCRSRSGQRFSLHDC